METYEIIFSRIDNEVTVSLSGTTIYSSGVIGNDPLLPEIGHTVVLNLPSQASHFPLSLNIIATNTEFGTGYLGPQGLPLSTPNPARLAYKIVKRTYNGSTITNEQILFEVNLRIPSVSPNKIFHNKEYEIRKNAVTGVITIIS